MSESNKTLLRCSKKLYPSIPHQASPYHPADSLKSNPFPRSTIIDSCLIRTKTLLPCNTRPYQTLDINTTRIPISPCWLLCLIYSPDMPPLSRKTGLVIAILLHTDLLTTRAENLTDQEIIHPHSDKPCFVSLMERTHWGSSQINSSHCNFCKLWFQQNMLCLCHRTTRIAQCIAFVTTKQYPGIEFIDPV